MTKIWNPDLVKYVSARAHSRNARLITREVDCAVNYSQIRMPDDADTKDGLEQE